MKVFIFMYNSSMENFHIMWTFLNELVNIYWKKNLCLFPIWLVIADSISLKKKIIFALYLCSCSTDSIFSHVIVCAHHLIITYMHNTKPGTFWKGYCPEKMASYYICTISCFHFLLTVFCGNAFVRAALHISRKLYTICNQKFRLSPLGIQ